MFAFANSLETSECEQLLCEILDLRDSMVGFVYNSASTKESAIGILGSKSFDKFELWLAGEIAKGRSGTFLVGDKASAPDFHLWEMLEQYCACAVYYELDPLTSFPNLLQFRKNFSQLPENAKYLASRLNQLPFNFVTAVFGATVSGDKMTGPGNPYAGSSGTY